MPRHGAVTVEGHVPDNRVLPDVPAVAYRSSFVATATEITMQTVTVLVRTYPAMHRADEAIKHQFRDASAREDGDSVIVECADTIIARFDLSIVLAWYTMTDFQ